MGETAEVLAREYGITREQSDCFALESQRKAQAAIAAGHFAREIAPVALAASARGKTAGRSRRWSIATSILATPRIESLRKLPPVFGEVRRAAGHHHRRDLVWRHRRRRGAGRRRRIGSRARTRPETAREDPRAGRAPASIRGSWASGRCRRFESCSERLGFGIEDFDLVELNEAFAPQVLAVLRDVPIAADRLNVNGGAIALGHPIGATGARIVVTLLHELERRGGRLGLATLCISGGMGMAMAIERIG